MTSTDQPTQYPVKTLKFDEDIAYHILEKPTPSQATQGPNENNIHVTAHQSFESLDYSVLHYITQKKLSNDKLLVTKVIYSHFKDILNGTSTHKTPPLLLVTGAPGMK
jgi:hypothetical protein